MMTKQVRKSSVLPSTGTCPLPSKSPSPHSASLITETSALSGLRVLFGLVVVLMHTPIYLSLVFDHPTQASRLHNGGIVSTLLSILQTFGTGAVDIFFLISGFLLQSAFSKTTVTLKSGAQYVLLRYLRLAPVYVTIILVFRTFGAPNCDSLMEFFILPAKDPVRTCNAVGWSTAVDFASHILLLPVLHNQRILAGVLLLTPALRAATWHYLGWPRMPQPTTIIDYIETSSTKRLLSEAFLLPVGAFDVNDPELVERRILAKQFTGMYFGVQYRIAAVVVGVMLHSCMREKNSLYRSVRRYPGLSFFGMCAVWGLYHTFEREILTTPVLVLIHRAAGRMFLAMATSVAVILACTINDTPSNALISKLLRTILTCRVVRALQPFSYIVYLLHPAFTFCLMIVPPKFRTDRFTPGWIFVMALKWYAFTMLVGLPIWLLEWVAHKGRRWIKWKLCDAPKIE